MYKINNKKTNILLFLLLYSFYSRKHTFYDSDADFSQKYDMIMNH